MKRRERNWLAAGLALALIVIGAIVWGLSGSRTLFVVTKPDDTYRVEIVVPEHWQRLFIRGLEDPAYVLLYNNVDGKLIATSQVVDFHDDARVIWLLREFGTVAVGMDVRFYHVPPIDRLGRRYPIERELNR